MEPSTPVVARLVPPPGLRVLITAGAAGIGAVMARAFVEAKAQVAICDVDQAALDTMAADWPTLLTSPVDVAEAAAVDAWVAEATQALGGIDVVVNNAGIAGPTAAIDDIVPDDWRRTIDVNLTGQYLVARASAEALRASAGVLLNVASVAGRLGYAYRTPYAASKWAIVGLTQSLAKELGPHGVRVNALLPGVVRGPRIQRVIADRAAALGVSYEEMEARYLAGVSLKRMVEPEDIAALALFLASEGGRNISGQALSVCGNVENL
ncbi:MAG: SDR family oxidoreductase [Candidatus Competibacterales bacterium]